MTITEIISSAAKEYARKWHQSNPDEFKNPDASPRADFTAGASFASTDPEMMKAMLKPFAEWIRTFELLERQNGQWVIESQLTDEQIVKAFIADTIKSKEDGI